MGPGHTSAQFGGASEFCSADGGARGAAEKRGALERATAWTLLAGVRFYQAVFAPAMPLSCKFYPTCSHYAAEAIQKHGARRGAWLAAKRLLRCRPGTKGGFDFVPEPDEFAEAGTAELAASAPLQANLRRGPRS